MNRVNCLFVGAALILLLALVPIGPQSEVEAQGKGKKPFILSSHLAVVDSTGRQVGGRVVGVMQGTRITLVAIPWGDTFLPVEVLRDSFLQSGPLFSTPDCTGQPYGVADGPFPSIAVGPDNTLYAESGSLQTIRIASRLDGENCTPLIIVTDLEVFPLVPVLDLDVFKPPFGVMAN